MKEIVIILGKRLNDDGSMLPELVRRLDKGLAYAKENGLSVIMTGGVANKAAGVSEASKMRDYAVSVGFPSDKIILEEKSGTTKENAKFCAPIVKALGVERIVLCSSPSHIFRPYCNPCLYFMRTNARVKICR